jgi:DNA-binding NtrC family response regulator
LARLLNAASQPIYVLDDLGRLAFCNRACLEWLGQPEEALLERRCAYHGASEVEPLDALAAGLAPPPQALAGEPCGAVVDAASQRRRASFVPLGGRDNLSGVVAFVDAQPLSNGATELPAEPLPAELHQQLRQLRQQLARWHSVDRLLGQSAALRRVRALVEVAAGSQASVLLVGPPGSGRQQVAGTIHYGMRGEPAGPLIPLACAILSADLLGSTVRAMATRPDGDNPGRGTLLLNDVDQLTAEAQTELAASLAGKAFGLRLVATSRRKLDELVGQGNFREDLALLLATLVIELPPLAARREDLPLLAQAFLEDRNAKSPKQLSGFTPEALDLMDLYPWPGNLDELAQVVADAHTRCQQTLVGVADLPQRLHLAADAMAHPRRKEETIVLDEFLGQVEQELIRRALARSKGNKAKAARLLGLTRPRLYRRMVQLGIE